MNCLEDNIRAYEQMFNRDKSYSKSLLFVQSSGTGKSRLADAYGQFRPMVTYVLRSEDDGFPPADKGILALMSAPSRDASSQHAEGTRKDNIWFHAIAVGILRATFENCEYISVFQCLVLSSMASANM